MKDHKDDFRGFYHLSEAWYGPSNLQNSKYTDEVNFGVFCPDGGTSGEMGVKWRELGGKNVPELTCFSDAWHTLAQFPDLIEAMGDLDDTDPTSKQFCALLMQLGFKDLTPRENPYGNTDSRKPRREILLENALVHLVDALASDPLEATCEVQNQLNNAKQLLGRRSIPDGGRKFDGAVDRIIAHTDRHLKGEGNVSSND